MGKDPSVFNTLRHFCLNDKKIHTGEMGISRAWNMTVAPADRGRLIHCFFQMPNDYHIKAVVKVSVNKNEVLLLLMDIFLIMN